jgi:hypothetical protein
VTAGTTVAVPPLLAGLCDDAAIFPPGNLPLDRAVPAHREHRAAGHAALVGAFVVNADRLPQLAGLVAGDPPGSLEIALTVGDPTAVAAAVAAADGVAALRVTVMEVAVPEGFPPGEVVPFLDAALAGRPRVAVFVELPRDGRRPELVRCLTGTNYLAKLRTGGIRADLYPEVPELAAAVVALTRAGLPFKATAGLHHAVRNTDPQTGFEQHGFLNVVTAVDAALAGADQARVERLLAERDPDRVAAQARAAGARALPVRGQFRSFGTCSINDPLEELVALGLLSRTGDRGGDLR